MKAQSKESQSKLTPNQVLEILVDGNKRFSQNLKTQRDLKEQVLATSHGQFPFAVVLSCIDSRVPVEVVFDLGIGDIFSVRVAGNVVNDDVLGSIEFGCKVAGSKVVVVMGHKKCGAVTAACDGVELGNITTLLHKIHPAVEKIKAESDGAATSVEEVAIENVNHSIAQILEKSPILAEMEESGQIEIVGAFYDVDNGQVEFLDELPS